MALTPEQLNRASRLIRELEGIESELQSIFGSTGVPQSSTRKLAVVAPSTEPAAKPKKKRKISAEGRARIIAAQRARWEKVRSGGSDKSPAKAEAKSAPKKARRGGKRKAKA